MSSPRKHTKHAIKQRGEVFTPTPLVNEMLDKLPPEVFSISDNTFLDNSCGNGQFLYEVMMRKMKCLFRTGITLHAAHKQALSTIYGIELDSKNAEECRQRLLKGYFSDDLVEIVNRNIICADALDQNHEGWTTVGFYWDENIKPVIKPKVDVVSEPVVEVKEEIIDTPKIEIKSKSTPKIPTVSVPPPFIKPISSMPKAVSAEEFRASLQEDGW